MTRFIQQSACEGRRPHGVVPDRLRSRPRLLSRLLEDRGALRLGVGIGFPILRAQRRGRVQHEHDHGRVVNRPAALLYADFFDFIPCFAHARRVQKLHGQ